MKGLAELVVSLCDLCEAEGRLLEAGILRTVRRVAQLTLGLLFGATALALLLAALYALLTSLVPTPAALALLGCASAAIAALFLWSARGAPAQAGEERTPEQESGQAAPVGASPGPEKEPARPASHDPWAEVAPYGHSAGLDAPREAGKGAPPEGGERLREK